jgi:chitin disaccharide deacetylase
MKYLIINADDFGMCHAMNAATIGLLEDNLISSATLMAPCPWFVEAAHYASSHPDKCIGIHLTLTSEWQAYRWGPVARTSLPSLVNADGYFPVRGLEVEKNAKETEVEIELRAQLALFKIYGITPSHMDNHMGTLYGFQGVQSFLPLAFKLCAELGLPFRFPRGVLAGDAITDHLPEHVLAKSVFGRVSANGSSLWVKAFSSSSFTLHLTAPKSARSIRTGKNGFGKSSYAAMSYL